MKNTLQQTQANEARKLVKEIEEKKLNLATKETKLLNQQKELSEALENNKISQAELERYCETDDFKKAEEAVKEYETLIENMMKEKGVTRKVAEEFIYGLNETSVAPETITETYEQQLGKYVPSLFGDPVETTVSDALRKKYGEGKGLWTKKINGIERDYINSNKAWREIVGENEGQLLADFQKLLSVLFKQKGWEFKLIKGTDISALQKNMAENMESINGFRDYHNDGGRFYKYCLEKF
jgi:hypothetical protein